jgi:uncharacterized BrkB/YihY/UPF0761 family membrane protein
MELGWVPTGVRETVRESFVERRIHVRSGFLALWCLEAVIPAMALTAAVAEWVGGRGAFADLVASTLSRSIFGNTSVSVSEWVTNLIGSTSLSSLGLFGVLSALFVVYQLYTAVLFDVNELLSCADGEPRTWTQHFLWFGAFCLWLGAFLVAGNLASGKLYLDAQYHLVPVALAMTTGLVYVGTAGLARNVADHAAVAYGSAVGAAWMEIVKLVFVVYSTSAVGTDALEVTYRQLAFLPLAFLWMHLTWFSFLLGVVVAARRTRDGA